MLKKISNLIIDKVSFISEKKIQILLLLIVLLGAFLRIYALDREFFTGDELWTMAFSHSRSPIYEVCEDAFKAGHSPLYFIMIHYWSRLFGSNEFSMRFPSVIFGIASIYILFLLIKTLFEEKIALLGSFLFSISTANIYYSQDARMYSLTVFFVLLSVLFLLKALNKNRNICWVAYIILTLFALSLSASVIPVILFELLFVTLNGKRYKGAVRKFIISLVLVALFYLPLLLVLIESSNTDDLSWIPTPNIFSLVNTFHSFGFKFRVHPFFQSKDSDFLFGELGLVFLGVMSIIGAFSVRKEKDKSSLLLLWLVMPMFTLLILSFLWTPVFGPVRYILYSSCAYYVLVAKGIMSFKNKNVQIILITLLCIAAPIILWSYYHSDIKHDWKTLNAYVLKDIGEDEILIWNRAIGDKWLSRDKYSPNTDYYYLLSTIKKPFPKDLKRLSWNKVTFPSKIDTEEYKGVWLISCSPPNKEIAFAETFMTSYFKDSKFKVVEWSRIRGLGVVFHYRRF